MFLCPFLCGTFIVFVPLAKGGDVLLETDFAKGDLQGWQQGVRPPDSDISFAAFETTQIESHPNKYVLRVDNTVPHPKSGSSYAYVNFENQDQGVLRLTLSIRFLDQDGMGNAYAGSVRVVIANSNANAGTYVRLRPNREVDAFSRGEERHVGDLVVQYNTWYDLVQTVHLSNSGESTYSFSIQNRSDSSDSFQSEEMPTFYAMSKADVVAVWQNENNVRNGLYEIGHAKLELLSDEEVDAAKISESNDHMKESKQGDNLALGKRYVMSPKPRYPLSTDPGDVVQLTDGYKIGGGHIGRATQPPWARKEMVGWSRPKQLVTITVDLKRDEAISGISFRTAAGGGSVTWPGQIAVFGSLDNKSWYFLGDLRAMSDRVNPTPSDGGGFGGATQHEFSSNDFQTHARYVRFAITGSSFVFSDEIEIFAGDPTWKETPLPGEALKGDEVVREWTLARRTRSGYESRLSHDRHQLEKDIIESPLSEEEKTELRDQVAKGYEEAMATELPSDKEFRAILPFNKGHETMYGARGLLWQKQWGETTVIEKPHRYEWVAFERHPVRTTLPKVSLEMAKNERRPDMLLLSNPSSTAREVKLEISDIKGEPGWLRIYKVPWTDTLEKVPMSTALLEVPLVNNQATLSLPPGISTKVWLQIDSSLLAAGKQEGTLSFSDVAGRQELPFDIRVSHVAMIKPPIDFYMWDYAGIPPQYDLTEENTASSVKLMKEYDINSPWASGAQFPKVTEEDFDEENRLKAPLDTSHMERWMTEIWPDADHYFHFMGFSYQLNRQPTFAGVTADDPAFEPRMAAWIRTITDRMEAIGVDPHKLIINPLDEAKTVEQLQIASKWIAAIKKADPRVRVYMNPAPPSGETREGNDYRAAFENFDIVCANRFSYLRNQKEVEPFYADMLKKGKKFHLYACSGPVKISDPTYYYRLSLWLAFSRGATGIGFWAFGDIGKAVSSWNEYTAMYHSFSPAFLSDKEAIPSIHLEALREGIQDYTLLKMLEKAVEEHPTDSNTEEARAILREAGNVLNAENAGDDENDAFKSGMWFDEPGSPKKPDLIRTKVLHNLEKITGDGV